MPLIVSPRSRLNSIGSSWSSMGPDGSRPGEPSYVELRMDSHQSRITEVQGFAPWVASARTRARVRVWRRNGQGLSRLSCDLSHNGARPALNPDRARDRAPYGA